MSVYMPHSGYADHQVEKVYKTILKTIEKERSAKIIGGDFNAELGPGEGIELSACRSLHVERSELQGRVDDTVATWEQAW